MHIRVYNIEVEDDVTAYAEYDNGMTATFITSTGETPGTNRLEISGTLGKVVVENDNIKFYRNRIDEREFNRTWDKGFGNPEYWVCDIPTDKLNEQHVGILKNIVDVINNGAEALAKKYSDRLNVVHFKDMTVIDNTPAMAEIFEGNMDYETIYHDCIVAGVEWVAIEQDICRRNPFESLKISYDNLKKRGMF